MKINKSHLTILYCWAIILLPSMFLPTISWSTDISILQKMVDEAKNGATITPNAGTYYGSLIITKPIVLNGINGVTINANGKGTVLIIKGDGVTIKNMHLTNSGGQHNDVDAAIQVKGDFNIITDNIMDNVLFGIDLAQAKNNQVLRNKISSKNDDLGGRGDSIRLWYSTHNTISHNIIDNTRDIVVWYSENNKITYNKISNGRYGTHFMYALYNLVEGNEYYNNSVGVFLMYSDSVKIKNNRISHGLGSVGMGIGMKESSEVTIEGNTIFYCGTGIYLDVSPYQPDTVNLIYSNHIASNSIGILFHNDWQGNLIKNNHFEDNYTSVSVSGGGSAIRHDWSGNFWADYQGFDRDKNNIGDSPHRKFAYADRLWMDVPSAAFYKGSPVLSLIDFLERLAPFTEPIEVFKDKTPKMTKNSKALVDMPYRTSFIEEEFYEDDEKPIRLNPFGLN